MDEIYPTQKVTIEVNARDARLLKNLANDRGMAFEEVLQEIATRNLEDISRASRFRRLASSAGEGIARDVLTSLDRKQ